MKLNEIINELNEQALAYVSIDVCNPKRIDALSRAATLLQSLTPRPIEEAPRDDVFLAYCSHNSTPEVGGFWVPLFKNINDEFFNTTCSDDCIYNPSHFIPLSAIQALMESGE